MSSSASGTGYSGYLLKIKILDECPNRDKVEKYYQQKVSNIGYAGDSGIDLICPIETECYTNTVTKVNLGISAEMVQISAPERAVSWDLRARSSISDTPLMLANGAGLIDSGYRGPIIAAMRCFSDRCHQSTIDKSIYIIPRDARLVQAVAPGNAPLKIVVVNSLSTSERGDRGFGSTGVVG